MNGPKYGSESSVSSLVARSTLENAKPSSFFSELNKFDDSPNLITDRQQRTKSESESDFV